MKQTPLFEKHQSVGAKIADFAGYAMPISYGAIKDEYLAVRERCGIFDISHMRPVHLRSADAAALFSFLQFLTCRDITEVKPGIVQYNALTNEKGGLVDDITIYGMNANHYLLIVNAANAEKVLSHLEARRKTSGAAVEIESQSGYALIAVQGPQSEAILGKVLKEYNLAVPPIFYYECAQVSFPGEEKVFCMISRTGYTGEDGFEILTSAATGGKFWDQLIAAGAAASGLAARDLLRMEVFYPLYGHELNEEWTPHQGGIGWLINSEKDYLGRKTVDERAAALPGKVRGFTMEEEGIPRQNYIVEDATGKEVGKVTSGGFSFIWNKGFGMAYVDNAFTKPGTHLFVRIRDQKKKIRIHGKSPYSGSIKRRS